MAKQDRPWYANIKAKHAELDRMIAELSTQNGETLHITQLKKNKLQLRELIEHLKKDVTIDKTFVYPLADETLDLLRAALSKKLSTLLQCGVNETNRTYVRYKNALSAVEKTLEERKEEALAA